MWLLTGRVHCVQRSKIRFLQSLLSEKTFYLTIVQSKRECQKKTSCAVKCNPRCFQHLKWMLKGKWVAEHHQSPSTIKVSFSERTFDFIDCTEWGRMQKWVCIVSATHAHTCPSSTNECLLKRCRLPHILISKVTGYVPKNVLLWVNLILSIYHPWVKWELSTIRGRAALQKTDYYGKYAV